MRRLYLLALITTSLPLSAQVVVDPGMPKAQVVARLGPPALERSSGDATYLFYKNNCERTCGMNDVVLLDKGVVVDAIFRSATRRYGGTSSSPRAIPAAEARKARATPPAAGAGIDGPLTISITGKKPVPPSTSRPDTKPPQ